MTTTKKADYQKWDEEAFQADIGVSFLDWIQRFVYKQLLQSAWAMSSVRPDLQNDSELWRMARVPKELWDGKPVTITLDVKPILKFFEQEDDLLYQKRLREDWGWLSNVREAASNGGRAGAATRWKSFAKPRNPEKEIPVLAKKILGEMDYGTWWKKDLKDLTGIYGGTAVVDAFESWARSLKHPVSKPVAAFCKVAVQYINLTPDEDNPDLDQLATSLYEIGGITFDRYRNGLLTLLESYSSEEIKTAYKEFMATRDDYTLKFAPRDFTSGAGKDIIEAGKLRKQKALDTQSLIEKETLRAREEVERQLAEIESEEIEEEL